MIRNKFFAGLAALSLLTGPLAPIPANAAASSQLLHAFMCASPSAGGLTGGKRIVNTSSTAAAQPTYYLNAAGCALIASADFPYFLSQGFYFVDQVAVAAQVGITASGTSSVTSSFTIPQYAFIRSIVIEETAGNAITGGLNIGNLGGATGIASAVAVGANASVAVSDAALSTSGGRIYSPEGVPTATTLTFAAVTSWNSAAINVSVIYGYY
jgi:hypothetical protein